MGLDMYLYQVPKVPGYDFQDLVKVDEKMESIIEAKNDQYEILKPYIKKLGTPNVFEWYGIFEKIGYWRKSNQIHNWFVDNVQHEEDDCGTYRVYEESLEELIEVCKVVLGNRKLAEELLPTQSGFFFGSTDYDEYYFEDLQDTVKILNDALSNVNFDTHYVAYSSSW